MRLYVIASIHENALHKGPGTAISIVKFSNDICAYWVHVSNMVDTVGEKKYQHLSFVAKAALTLSHSNASPERGFSVNNALVTTDGRSLSERSIVTVHVVKEAVRVFGSCTKVPITKDLIHSVMPILSMHCSWKMSANKH